MPLYEATLNLPDHKGSAATGSLVFSARVPALGFTTYFVEETQVAGKGNSECWWFSCLQMKF